MKNAQFDEDSVIQKNTDIDNFVPPYPGWNYVRVLNHPEDKDPYMYIKEGPNTINVGNGCFLPLIRILSKYSGKLRNWQKISN